MRTLLLATALTLSVLFGGAAIDSKPLATTAVAAEYAASVHGPYGSREEAYQVAKYWQRKGYDTSVYKRGRYWYVKVY